MRRAITLLVQHVSYPLRVEVAFLVKPALGQGVFHKFREAALPWPEGSGKAALPTSQDVRGQDASESPPENILFMKPAHFQVGWNPAAQFDQFVIEERYTCLQPIRHRGRVQRSRNVVRETRIDFQVLQLGKATPSFKILGKTGWLLCIR